ncbi:MAG: LPS export ABC transporter permease LptG [Methylobacillus sp.]|jgi:lipopolysaccharide export system permease protein|nr:LPS export ABC transporter permease LptG [Methylobacillus sp.]
MKLFSRYLFREIVYSIVLVMVALLALFAFFDLIQELESLDKGAYGLPQIMLYVLLSVPGHVYEVIPVAVLIGTLYALAQFGRSSELVVLRTSGISMMQMAVPLLCAGALFTGVTFIGGELVAPLTEKTAQKLRSAATNPGDSVIARNFRSGVWVKDGNNFINIEEVLSTAGLRNIHIYELDQDYHLRAIRNAKTAQYNGKHWEMTDVTQTTFADNSISTETFAQMNWNSVIQPELLNVLLVAPEKMSVWNLYFYIQHLAENHQKTARHEIALWSKMTYPIACLVMVILALPFGFLQQRAGGISAKISVGILLGISYQVLNRVFVHLGLLNDWPPPMSATIPTLLFFAAGMAMLVWNERR